MKYIEEDDFQMLKNEIIKLTEEKDKVYFASEVLFDEEDWKK